MEEVETGKRSRGGQDGPPLCAPDSRLPVLNEHRRTPSRGRQYRRLRPIQLTRSRRSPLRLSVRQARRKSRGIFRSRRERPRVRPLRTQSGGEIDEGGQQEEVINMENMGTFIDRGSLERVAIFVEWPNVQAALRDAWLGGSEVF